ncbi:hypothetical protein OsJ_35693 [Oryza sativa Japonica Group]|uniref:Uncharacterized protein n=1 Tax=Oryza sativa subsp. japonica TaxID=39947 RepID=B9GCJ8_ORYSJ|nr:hypothetical protein OsJ_35693 [Oryza sativa Japonica Group]
MGKVVEEVVVEGKVVEMDRVMDPGMVLDMVRAVEFAAEAMGKVVVVVVAVEDKVVELMLEAMDKVEGVVEVVAKEVVLVVAQAMDLGMVAVPVETHRV